ncbi:hypothetical protein AX15_005071 [Amanita polypyramis BW_CC]|nr:hypothetical protein AX15_005071 [Amanita polypyramis BW_CC]
MSTTNFSPTPPETALVNQIFVLFDSQKLGVLTGDVAVKAFAGAKLPPTVLGEIWNIADEENKGWLSRKGVSIAMRLIAWAQKGENISKDLLGRPGPLPTIEGVTTVSQQNTGLSLPKSPPASSLPPLTPQDCAKFHNLFYKAGPQNGLVSGEKARGVFLKSKLTTDQLIQIWNLADTQDRGALDIADFTIGMYFIQAVMSRQLSVIPLSLPPGLYQQAAGDVQPMGSHLSSNSGSLSPIRSGFVHNKSSAVQPQYTGQSMVQPNHTGMSQKVSSNISARPTGPTSFLASPFAQPSLQWDISVTEKVKADHFFDELDMHKRGYIEGDVAVPFMLKSNLPEEDLARIWDLADLDNNGRLTRDGFAVVLHLIQKRLSRQELPAVLPPSLIPPSMRHNNVTPFSTTTQQRPPEPVNDLFSFDEMPSTLPVSSQSTGSINTIQPQNTGPKLSTFTPTAPPHAMPNDPFISSNSTLHQDLLGDDDDGRTASPPLQDKSAEIGNTQNQLNSTTRSLETVKHERASVEQILANQAAQLSSLQTQLSSAKAAYETESKLFATLKERQTNQLSEIQKLREELIHAESNLSAVRVEKAEIEGAFLRDKEEARDLHRQMVETGKEAERLKQELERVKKEAKQQKGLLAIARKQLSTKESERAKAEKELEEATHEVTSIIAERERAEAELAKDSIVSVLSSPERTISPDSVTYAAQHPLPISPDMSGAGSGARSNNPFEKLNISSGTSCHTSCSAETNANAQPIPPSDLFSFDKAFIDNENANQLANDGAQPTTNGIAQSMESPATTPKVQPMNLTDVSPQAEGFPSPAPDSEYFVTPPTSSGVRSQAASPNQSSSFTHHLSTQSTSEEPHSIEGVESGHLAEVTVPEHFPAIEDFSTQFVESPSPRGEFQNDHKTAEQESREQHAETDLSTELKELDVEDSDSDSEEEIPLAELAEKNRPASQNKETNVPADKHAEPSKVSFDDIFGVTASTTGEPTRPTDAAPQPPADSNVNKPVENITGSTSPFETSSTEKPNNATTAPASTSDTGISAFDEALGMVPTRSGVGTSDTVSSSQQFSFDAAFDDNFDFSSATTSTAAPPLTVPPPGFPTTADAPTYGADGFNFLSASTQVVPTTTETVKPFSFDEVFSGLGSDPSTNSSAPSTQANAQPSPTTAKSEPISNPFPSSIPASPQERSPPRDSTASQEMSIRSLSPTPQRTKSPPNRGSSPKPRPSTSSSKEEKASNIPTRHSKLSIRLFRRGKKQQQQQQETQHTPPREQLGSIRSISPTDDDDIRSVKQLVSMGFNRVQAVDALERSGYDFQKALNTLLGSQ